MKKSYVYKITCKINGEFYFGSSFNAKSDSYWGSGRKIKERIAQYGKENFIKEILGEFDDRVAAHKKENQYIENFRNDEKCLNERLEHKFGSFSDETLEKHSAANRGEKNPMYGKRLSDETRAKMSAARRGEKNPWYGKHLSDETRAKISASLKGLMSGEKSPMYGKHLSDETRAKIGAAQRGEKNHNFGKHFSDETRAKIGAAQRGKIVSDETRAKLSASLKGLMSGEKNPMYGKRFSDETRAKISAALRGKHWRKNKITGKREYYD